MNIINLLKQDHIKVKNLLKRIEITTERTAKNRKVLLTAVKKEFKQHEKIEETILYPTLKENSTTRSLVFLHSAEVELVEELLTKLQKENSQKEEWMAKFTVLKNNLLLHISQEESFIFLYASKLISKEQLNEMGRKMLLRKTSKVDKAKVMKNHLTQIKNRGYRPVRHVVSKKKA